MNRRPEVGTGVCITKDGKVLLGQRRNTHGKGTWCFPGGHLEFGESWEDCACREVLEETGLVIKKPVFVAATNDVFFKHGKHYITVFMQAAWAGGEPQVLEPDTLIKWAWFDWDNLPQPLFLPVQHLVESGFRP